MKKFLRFAVPVLILLMLAFIFGNSLKSADSSAELSEELSNRLAFLPVKENVLRKAAHFVEFAILGALFASHAVLCGKKSFHAYTACAFSSLLCALFDETLQLIPAGRSSSAADVWLDFAGALAGIALVALSVRAAKRVREQKNGKKN